MNWIEIIATSFSLISVGLTIRRSVWCWPTGIIGILAFLILFFQGKDWCNMILQIIFVIQSIHGWIWWRDNKDVPVDRMSKWRLRNTIETTGIIFIISFILTKVFSGNFTLLDSITASLSIMALLLTAYKILESWIWWIIADLLYIFLFIQNGYYLSSITYFVFLCLAILGFFNWKKEYDNQK
jgi:nicotinamide mononucleotide transporter